MDAEESQTAGKLLLLLGGAPCCVACGTERRCYRAHQAIEIQGALASPRGYGELPVALKSPSVGICPTAGQRGCWQQ